MGGVDESLEGHGPNRGGGMMDESKLWELAQSVERTAANQKHILKLLDRLERRVEEVSKHDDLQEERMARMQETVASLAESVHRVEVASTRLRHIALGFVVLLGALAVLTGLLGSDVVSKIIKAGAAGLM